MKRFICIALILVFILGLTSCQVPMTIDEIESIMGEILEAGEISSGTYSNKLLGIRFQLPAEDFFDSYITKLYSSQRELPSNINRAAKSVMVATADNRTVMLKDYHYIDETDGVNVFNLQIRYNKYPQNEYKNTIAEEYLKLVRDDNVRFYVGEYREEYKNTYKISKVLCSTIAGQKYFHFTQYHIIENIISDYYIVNYANCYLLFIFNSKGKEVNYEMVNQLLKSIEYFKPQELSRDE